MSRGNFQEENQVKYSTITLNRVPEDEGKVLNPFLWPNISENQYNTYEICTKSYTRLDRPAQTESSLSKPDISNPVLNRHTYVPVIANSPKDRTDWPIEKGETSDEDYPRLDSSIYETHFTRPSSSLYGISMNNRKNMTEKGRGTDLERKKLEAELKAAQEIARIQQTVIEKRLALELASIHNGKEGKDGKDNRELGPHQIPHPPPKPQQDFALMEELTRRNPVIENNYASEIEPPKIRPPPRPVSAMPSRLVNSERLRTGFGNDLQFKRTSSRENYGSSNSSPSGMIDVQAPEIKYYKPSSARIQRPPLRVPDQMPVEMSTNRDDIYERPAWTGHQSRNRFSWREFFGKMKKGFKRKTREDWD